MESPIQGRLNMYTPPIVNSSRS